MRIVSGEFRGRRLVAPKGRGVRPTLEKVREAIFDSLGPVFEGADVLDLFAGSGAMGFEALSRGAARVVFVDVEQRPVDAINENARLLGVSQSRMSILTMTAENAVRRLSQSGSSYDVVFVDPPWESGLYEQVMLALSLSGVIRPGGIVVVEHSRRFPVEAVYGPLIQKKDRQYGDTCVAYFHRPVSVSPGENS